jgi:hypothetical protein
LSYVKGLDEKLKAEREICVLRHTLINGKESQS